MRISAASSLPFFLFVILLSASFVSGLGPAIFGIADEAILAYSIIILATQSLKIKTAPRFSVYFFIYFLYSIGNSYLSPFSPNIVYAAAQSVIHLKLFLVSFSAVVLYKAARHREALIIRVFFSFILLFCAGLFLNIILQEKWNLLFSNTDIQYRYGFIRPAGIFGHYAPNGYFLSLFLLTFFMMSNKTLVLNKRQVAIKFFSLSIIELLASFPMTVRKGLFIIFPYGAYVISTLKPAKRVLFAIASVTFVSILLLSISNTQFFLDTTQNIKSFFSDDHNYIRGLISYYGYQLFIEHFPFGVGNGLYGSVFSNMDHSVYKHIGLNLSPLMQADGSLTGIYDSGLASVIAESGFFGLALITLTIREFFRFNKSNLDQHNYQTFKIITFFAIILSITEPVWQNGFFTTFYTICLLYIYTKNNKYMCFGRWKPKKSDK